MNEVFYMTYNEKWNEIVEYYNKDKNAAENIIQHTWVSHFVELFGYSERRGEIEEQNNISIGASNSLKPDIVIKDGNTNLFVVELKQHIFPFKNDHETQLLSYLKQLRNSTGILVSNKIYIYAHDFNKNDNEQDKTEIEFIHDNPDGIKLVELLSKGNFNETNVRNFVLQKIESSKNVDLIKSAISNKLIVDLLREWFVGKNAFDMFEFEQAVENLDFIIKQKTITPTPMPTTATSHSLGKAEKSDGMKRNEAKSICNSNGLSINGYFSFSNITAQGRFANDIPIRNLSQDWHLILNNQEKNELYVFRIPKGELTVDKLYIVNNKYKHVAILHINCDDETFTDRSSKIKFAPWLVKTIKY
jgi:hypothetical protein